MTNRSRIPVLNQAAGALQRAPVFLLLFALPWTLSAAGKEEKAAAALGLDYAVSIDPESRKLKVTCTLRGHEGEPIRKFESQGMREKVNIAFSKTADGSMVYRYDLPVRQAAFGDPFKPVLNGDSFTGFCSSLFLLPRVEGREFGRVALTITAPEEWKVVTSRGIGAKWKLDCVTDLMGTLVCAGDYAAYQFDLDHRGSDASTRFLVAIRGEREWDDKVFVDEFKRIARGQMDYFGGGHPAPVQFLALHLLPQGAKSRIPGFNRRAPGHDTIMALHTPARPRNHFEFLGMLAHEHLHNWYPNVMKSDLGPWFMEGLTDYVAYRGLLANGLHDRKQFTGMLSKWHREYHYCLERNDQRLMPYRRGMIAAWVFDIELRRATDGRHGLTDVLRNLIDSEPDGGLVRQKHFVAMLKEVSGRDMEPLYKHLVEDAGAIDLPKHLAGTGFRIADKSSIEIDPQSDAEKELFDAILSK